MNYFVKKLIIFIIALVSSFTIYGSEYIRSRDLLENGTSQRRDLSFPGSRIVLNFYDFHSKKSEYEYSNRPTLPLNVAYLSTDRNNDGRQRFSRSITDLLTIRCLSSLFYNDSIDDNEGEAVEYSTEWYPHCLKFRSKYSDNSTLSGTDFFYDINTIVRTIHFENNKKEFMFSGNYNGYITFCDNTLIIDNDNICYAITFSQPVLNPYYDENKWYIGFKPSLNGTLNISISFVNKGDELSTLLNQVKNPIINNDIEKKMLDCEIFWDDFLRKVPKPENFKLSRVNTFGITEKQVKETYYKAWVFICQNLLYSDSEEYPFPQICAGKASLWDEGEVRAPFSAAWESFFGIQFYAYIDVDTSWSAFKGLMSLVDEEGMLGGESLPSRKAQTAMLLYKLSGDERSLVDVYPALKRYMKWRINITHWVYGPQKATPYLKDAEFAFSALRDMEYMVEIAQIIGYKDDVKEWKNCIREMKKNCLEWFWETPESLPVQYYNIQNESRQKGNTVWVTTGFNVDGLLSGKYKQSMIRLFHENYDIDKPFAGFSIPKYPDMSYTIYGLLKHGYKKEANELIEINIRDIIRANSSFAEQYIGEIPKGDGVRPSLFGASTIVDFVWLLNHYQYDIQGYGKNRASTVTFYN